MLNCKNIILFIIISWFASSIYFTASAEPEKQIPQPEKKQEELKLPSEEDLSGLVSKMGSAFLSDRKDAKRELIKLKEYAVPALIAALDNDEFRIRLGAIEVLGFIGSETAAPKLIALLKEKDTTVVAEIRKALVRIGVPAMKYVAEAMKNETEEDKKYFEPVVYNIIKEILRSFICSDSSYGSYPGQFEMLKQMGAAANEALVKIVEESDDSYLPFLAINALGEIGDKNIIPQLKKIFDEKEYCREEAAVAIYKLGDNSCCNMLIEQYNRETIDDPESTQAHYSLAYLYHKMDKFDEAAAGYKKAIELGQSLGGICYNYTCLLAARGKKKEAVQMLKKALENGYDSLEWISKDKELDNIRDEEEFKSILKEHFGEKDPRTD
ncbi:MAG: HEAT repeat domain-containing protein [Planctomycetota bacterium]